MHILSYWGAWVIVGSCRYYVCSSRLNLFNDSRTSRSAETGGTKYYYCFDWLAATFLIALFDESKHTVKLLAFFVAFGTFIRAAKFTNDSV
ncbi:hypothetical protein ABHZ81_00055 [Bacteroides thetaiotaomicron]|nr:MULTISPECIES: hypothetical protein [Bacteroides]MBL3931017.1 hypothetical protein [Bacteroides thetaiotaomicron]MBL3955059.1 hypothetical protein [Bacteroides thetaiotaomicron]MCS2907644.1 hypothetical protein [Bacteroides thetaiotaomicron]MCS3085855.1 hypothetical protein [Bacteroides thetaiotaomicron]MCS3269044.1 hypothetical protein [Bacteroides thetaiotaomicron]